MYAVFRAAMEAGGRQLGPFEIEWDISGNCLLPVRRDITARKQQGVEKRGFYLAAYDRVEDTFNGIWAERVPVVTYGKERYGPYVVHLTAKCRKCDNCRAARQFEGVRPSGLDLDVLRTVFRAGPSEHTSLVGSETIPGYVPMRSHERFALALIGQIGRAHV